MLKYLAVRLLGLIPLLFLITLLGFGYATLFPLSNEVLLSGEILPEASQEEPKRMKEKKKALVESYSLHLPLFYFQIRSLAEEHGPGFIEDPTERKLFRKLCLDSGNGEAVNSFREHLNQLEQQLKKIDSARNFLIDLRLLRRRSFEAFPHAVEKLHERYPSQSQSVWQAYSQIYEEVTPWKTYIPQIQYHGSQNQYHLWLGNLLGGFDLGNSYQSSSMNSVKERLDYYLPWTIIISLLSIFIALMVSIPLGVWVALRANSWKDKVIRNIFFFLDGIPSFLLAVIIVRVIMNPDVLGLPGGEYANSVPETGESRIQFIFRMIPHLGIPLFAYSYGYIIFLSRMVRANLLDMLGQDFLLAAKVRAIPESKRVWKYAVKNALLPVITVSGAFIPSLVSGSVILEKIFGIRGMGTETLRAVSEYDVPVLLGILVLSATLTLIGYLISDLISMWVDPRVRFDT